MALAAFHVLRSPQEQGRQQGGRYQQQWEQTSRGGALATPSPPAATTGLAHEGHSSPGQGVTTAPHSGSGSGSHSGSGLGVGLGSDQLDGVDGLVDKDVQDDGWGGYNLDEAALSPPPRRRHPPPPSSSSAFFAVPQQQQQHAEGPDSLSRSNGPLQATGNSREWGDATLRHPATQPSPAAPKVLDHKTAGAAVFNPVTGTWEGNEDDDLAAELAMFDAEEDEEEEDADGDDGKPEGVGGGARGDGPPRVAGGGAAAARAGAAGGDVGAGGGDVGTGLTHGGADSRGVAATNSSSDEEDWSVGLTFAANTGTLHKQQATAPQQGQQAVFNRATGTWEGNVDAGLADELDMFDASTDEEEEVGGFCQLNEEAQDAKAGAGAGASAGASASAGDGTGDDVGVDASRRTATHADAATPTATADQGDARHGWHDDTRVPFHSTTGECVCFVLLF